MTGLYIFLGIILALFLLLSIKARVVLEFNDELTVSVKLLCFNIKIAPPKEKKPIKIKDYSFSKHQKRLKGNYEKYLKKQQKKDAKKLKKAEKKKESKKVKKKKSPSRSPLDWVNIAGAVIGALFSRFAKRLHIRVARLNIKVATGDAASTAILYGAIIQSVAYIIEILQKITNIDKLKSSQISVEPDYLSEQTKVDLCFVFSLRAWHIFDILFGTIGKAIKKFFETAPPKPTKDENEKTNDKNQNTKSQNLKK